MKLITAILGVVLMLAMVFATPSSLFSQKVEGPIKPGKRYKQLGATVFSPNEPDWRILKAQPVETEFAKTTTDKKFTAFVKTAKIAIYDVDDELFANLEKLKTAEVDETLRDSIHYYYTEFKSTKCLQYDGIFNAPNTGYKHRNMNGYICRHPDDKGTIIQFEFSNFSNDRGYLKPEAQLSKAFFENIQFTKLR